MKRITYEGWPDAYQLSNGVVDLVFVPQIGRIMRYGYVGGTNLLWVNPGLTGKTTDLVTPSADWQNYGGDKLWPAPQKRWGWPPEPAIDSGPHTVKVLPNNHLQVTGSNSKKHGIRFQREIALANTGTEVTFTNTMVNLSQAPVEWSVWQVTQIDSPDQMRMPLHKGGRFPQGYYDFEGAGPKPESVQVTDKEILLQRNPAHSCKIGNDSPIGVLTAIKGDLVFELITQVQPGKNYPDDGCALEIYTNPDPNRYVELEVLSPIVTLARGKSYPFTTKWRLSRTGTGASRQDTNH